MPVYEVSGLTTIVTATIGAPLCALRAVTRPVRIWEIHAFYVTAPTTSGEFGLCRSTALGTGTLTSVTPVARSTATGIAAATSLLNTAWATLAPTNAGAGAIFRRFAASATIGNGIIWTFDREPLEVAGSAGATSELILVNAIATAPGTLAVTFVVEE
jgi:hypothetical protein